MFETVLRITFSLLVVLLLVWGLSKVARKPLAEITIDELAAGAEISRSSGLRASSSRAVSRIACSRRSPLLGPRRRPGGGLM